MTCQVGFHMGADEIRDALRTAGDVRRRAKHEARLDTPEVRALIHTATRAHMSAREIARLLGASHTAVNDLLREGEAEQE